eukprot:CAMPEP_0178989532 /NCGR_PEP_ID=MMETSP0795-20121207/4430_1 /TAXON_ID=88552 /ORGANISM="Amoebophrya sp., Strain Ameob2" /LENGTH=199 /DNA_ID=CAMNT_0020680951 /DNA_START=2535 /DNA_END=3135 /DNA_ORIENTATION=+
MAPAFAPGAALSYPGVCGGRYCPVVPPGAPAPRDEVLGLFSPIRSLDASCRRTRSSSWWSSLILPERSDTPAADPGSCPVPPRRTPARTRAAACGGFVAAAAGTLAPRQGVPVAVLGSRSTVAGTPQRPAARSAAAPALAPAPTAGPTTTADDHDAATGPTARCGYYWSAVPAEEALSHDFRSVDHSQQNLCQQIECDS